MNKLINVDLRHVHSFFFRLPLDGIQLVDILAIFTTSMGIG